MQGLPWQISESVVMRDNSSCSDMSLRSSYCKLLQPKTTVRSYQPPATAVSGRSPMRAIKDRHRGRLRRHGHWGHILTFDTPPHPRPVDIPKFPGVGASPAPLNPRTTYGLIAIIPSVSRSANNSKSTNPPEPSASVVVFSFLGHATIQFMARHPPSAICHFPSIIFHPPPVLSACGVEITPTGRPAFDRTRDERRKHIL